MREPAHIQSVADSLGGPHNAVFVVWASAPPRNRSQLLVPQYFAPKPLRPNILRTPTPVNSPQPKEPQDVIRSISKKNSTPTSQCSSLPHPSTRCARSGQALRGFRRVGTRTVGRPGRFKPTASALRPRAPLRFLARWAPRLGPFLCCRRRGRRAGRAFLSAARPCRKART